MSKNPVILVVEGDAAEAAAMEGELRKEGLEFSVERAATDADFLRAIRDSPPDVVLADCAAPGFNVSEALKLLRHERPNLPFICLFNTMGGEGVVELMKQGATDFVCKKTPAKLVPAVRRALGELDTKSRKRRATAGLHENESRFRAIFEGAGAGIAVESLEGNIVETNRALQQMLGYNAEELQQLKRHDFTHAQDHQEEENHYQRLLAGESDYYQVEKRFVRKDGRIIWGRLTVSLVRDAEGKPQFPLAMIEDITERQRAEEALLQHAAIVASSNDAIVGNTFDGIIISWNPAAERLYGYAASEANGRPVSIVLQPEKEEEFARSLERIKRGERVDNVETEHRRKDGGLIHVSTTMSPIKDAAGKIIGASSIAHDVTERKRAETRSAAFAQLGQRLSSASTAVEAARIILEIADRLLGWDSAGIDLWSPERKTLTSILCVDVIDGKRMDVPKPYDESAPSPGALRVLERGAQLILRKPPYQASPELIAFGDKKRPSASLMFVQVRNGAKIIGILTVQSYSANAYTERGLETLQALADHCGGALERIRAEAENQKLAAFVQFNPNPVLEISADGEVKYSNEAARQMARSLGKQHLSEFLPPDTAVIVKDSLASGKSKLRHETVIHNRTISWSFYPIQGIGVVHCYAGDITERQDLEAQLRQSQKMESVGQLAGGIAHDFNNILTVIHGHSSLLAALPKLPEGALESAQQIATASERAANLTRQLLTFSRRQIIQPKNLDLNEIVNHMTKMLRRLLGEDITLQVNYAPNLPLVHADPGMIEQILMNLSVNARDAMPKGGRLFINTSVVQLDAAQAAQNPGTVPGEYVCLAVKDTGIGIVPENLPHIFEPFFTTKDVGKGTGLGLATVYGIVQQHRGWISVSSKPDEETAFHIFLPAITAKKPARDAQSSEPKVRGGHETILVVEDEGPVRVLVRSVLERHGYRVLEANSGVDALPIWLEHKDDIHLLLTDMVMPHGVSGRELAERLRGDRPELKVMYASGYSRSAVGTDMVLKEGLNFLQKPFHPRKLAQAVRDCLDE